MSDVNSEEPNLNQQEGDIDPYADGPSLANPEPNNGAGSNPDQQGEESSAQAAAPASEVPNSTESEQDEIAEGREEPGEELAPADKTLAEEGAETPAEEASEPETPAAPEVPAEESLEVPAEEAAEGAATEASEPEVPAEDAGPAPENTPAEQPAPDQPANPSV